MRLSSMSDIEKQALQIMATAFKRSLKEHIGSLEDKPPIELVAWSKALIELELDFRQALLVTNQQKNKVRCPFCADDYRLDELPKNFAFEARPDKKHRGYLCCNLCNCPVKKLEELEDDN